MFSCSMIFPEDGYASGFFWDFSTISFKEHGFFVGKSEGGSREDSDGIYSMLSGMLSICITELIYGYWTFLDYEGSSALQGWLVYN